MGGTTPTPRLNREQTRPPTPPCGSSLLRVPQLVSSLWVLPPPVSDHPHLLFNPLPSPCCMGPSHDFGPCVLWQRSWSHYTPAHQAPGCAVLFTPSHPADPASFLAQPGGPSAYRHQLQLCTSQPPLSCLRCRERMQLPLSSYLQPLGFVKLGRRGCGSR